MVAHPMVALLLLPLNQSLALQPLGLRLEKARQLTPRPHKNGKGADERTIQELEDNIISAAEDVGGSLADKFNDLSSIHFATPQFSYIPTYISEAAVVKTPDLDQVVHQKKSTLENLLNPTKESVRDLIQLKRDAINNIVNPQKTTVEKYVKSRRKKIGDLIEFKKSAINNFVVPKVFPKRKKIEHLIKLKRSKLAELGSQFPGSERLRHDLLSEAKKYHQKLFEPLRQAYQGLKEGLADGAGQFYRAPEEDAPPISPSYSLPSSSFSPSNPEGQAILTDQEWQQTDNTFKPIFRDGTPLEKSNRKPEQQESLVTTDSPAGCPFAPQFCPTKPPSAASVVDLRTLSRLRKGPSILAEKETTQEKEAVVERVVRGRLRVAAKPPLRHSQKPQLRSPRGKKPTKPGRHLASASQVQPPRPSRSPAHSRKKQTPRQGLSQLPEGFHGTLRIPKETTPINRAVHAKKIFLNIDDFMENLRRRGLPTESLAHPNIIPIRNVKEKQVQVLQGRLKTQEPAVLPRNKVLSNDILATTANRGGSKMEINENRRIDSGPEELSRRKESGVTENNQESTDTNTHDTSPIGSFYAEPSPPPSFSNYGKKIQDPDKREEAGLEIAEAERRVFADDDLELVVGLVKPLVARLKAGVTNGADDQTGVLQNIQQTPKDIPSNDLEETTTSEGLVISDYPGEDEVTLKSLSESQGADEREPDEPIMVVDKLPDNIEVMNLVTDVSETEVKEPVNQPIYMAMTDKDAQDAKEDEVFLLPAGHGLQFSFKVGDLAKLEKGGSLDLI